MRKHQMQEKLDKLEYELKISELKAQRSQSAYFRVRGYLNTYKSIDTTYKRALELMELRENLTFEQALTALTQLEQKDEN